MDYSKLAIGPWSCSKKCVSFFRQCASASHHLVALRGRLFQLERAEFRLITLRLFSLCYRVLLLMRRRLEFQPRLPCHYLLRRCSYLTTQHRAEYRGLLLTLAETESQTQARRKTPRQTGKQT